MADRYFVVPDHFFSAVATFGTADAALDAAAPVVDRDQKPRLVVRVVAEVRPLTAPRVHVVQVAEAIGG